MSVNEVAGAILDDVRRADAIAAAPQRAIELATQLAPIVRERDELKARLAALDAARASKEREPAADDAAAKRRERVLRDLQLERAALDASIGPIEKRVRQLTRAFVAARAEAELLQTLERGGRLAEER